MCSETATGGSPMKLSAHTPIRRIDAYKEGKMRSFEILCQSGTRMERLDHSKRVDHFPRHVWLLIVALNTLS